MKCIKTYKYLLTEEDIRKIIVEHFNKTPREHLPATTSNVTLLTDKKPHCEPEVSAVILIDEEDD